ncbi:MAG: hypothetical protein ACYTX0_60000 [Nostoc sp.]
MHLIHIASRREAIFNPCDRFTSYATVTNSDRHHQLLLINFEATQFTISS